VPHVVESGENFWTISRLYYSSGRYYRALWKANAEKVPDIRGLHVGDVILIPPVEDLDPAAIEPPRTSPAPGRVDSGTRTEIAGSPSPKVPRRESVPTARTTRSSTLASSGAIPVRRSNRSDTVLDLPVSETVSGRDRGPRRDGTGPAVDEPEEDGPEIRASAPSRSPVPRGRPVYKVRPYDTLRSIARATLGDARRAGEILELNRDVIGDQTHLATGQILELPDEADTPRGRTGAAR
jgi:nucleoid-associated protein YgaU